jgi:hypothetical protein
MFFFSNHNHERNTADMMIDDAPGLRVAELRSHWLDCWRLANFSQSWNGAQFLKI